MKLKYLSGLALAALISSQMGCSKGQDPDSNTDTIQPTVEKKVINFKKYYFKASCISGSEYYDLLASNESNQNDPLHPAYTLGADLYLLDNDSFRLDLLTIQVLSEDSEVRSYRVLYSKTYSGKIITQNDSLYLEGIGSLSNIQTEQGSELVLKMSSPTPYQNTSLRLFRTTINLVPSNLQKSCH